MLGDTIASGSGQRKPLLSALAQHSFCWLLYTFLLAFCYYVLYCQ